MEGRPRGRPFFFRAGVQQALIRTRPGRLSNSPACQVCRAAAWFPAYNLALCPRFARGRRVSFGRLTNPKQRETSMSLKKTGIAALMAAAGLAMSQGALAQSKGQDTGWYVGGSIGQAEADGTCPAGFTCDFKDTDWKIFGGYRINRNFAVEAFYADHGEISVRTGGVSVDGASQHVRRGCRGHPAARPVRALRQARHRRHQHRRDRQHRRLVGRGE